MSPITAADIDAAARRLKRKTGRHTYQWWRTWIIELGGDAERAERLEHFCVCTPRSHVLPS